MGCFGQAAIFSRRLEKFTWAALGASGHLLRTLGEVHVGCFGQAAIFSRRLYRRRFATQFVRARCKVQGKMSPQADVFNVAGLVGSLIEPESV